MGFTELLTIVFIVLKALGKIDWSWWIVFLPEMIAAVLYIIVSIYKNYVFRKATKHFNKSFKSFLNDDKIWKI